jgi:hypothetical protein
MLKRTLMLLLLAASTLFAVACDDTAEEGSAIFAVSDINGNDPVIVASGAAATVDMTFRWRPYFDPEATIVEAAPHGDYIIESYRITWSAVTSGATVPSPREEDTHIFLPVYDLVNAGINLVTAAESGTIGSGNVMKANMEFTAREMGTDRDAKFSATVSVTVN